MRWCILVVIVVWQSFSVNRILPCRQSRPSRAAGSIGGRAPIAFLPLADGPDVIKFDAGLWLFCSEVLQNGEGGKLR
jgi:hypothetical protein